MRAFHTAVAVFVAVSLGASGVAALPVERPFQDDDVVARVNGTAIRRKAVREVVQARLAREPGAPDPNRIPDFVTQAIEALIAFELLYQESQARGISITDDAVDGEIRRAYGQLPSDQALRAQGTSQADLRRETRRRLAVDALTSTQGPRPRPIPDDAVRAYYEGHKEEFRHPAQVRVSHILIRVPDGASPAVRDAARARVVGLRAEVLAGADFGELARAQSQDPVSKSAGGDLGYIAPGDMPASFERVAFGLPPGQLSEPVTTPYGVHVLRVTDRRESGYQSLDEVAGRIRAILQDEERVRQQAALVDRLRSQGKVEVLEPLP